MEEDLGTFLLKNNLAHLVPSMMDQELTLDILMQANDSELSHICPKIADKIKLRVALDKIRIFLETNKQTEEVSIPVRTSAFSDLNECVLLQPQKSPSITTTDNSFETHAVDPQEVEQTSPTITTTDNSFETYAVGPQEVVPKSTTTQSITKIADISYPEAHARPQEVQEWSLTLSTAELDLFNTTFDFKSLEPEKGLRRMLSSISTGRVLLKKADNREKLNSRDRAFLVKIIVEAEINSLEKVSTSIRKDVWQQWAKEVAELFVDESAELYYVPYNVIDGKVNQASGHFHNRLITLRRYINENENKKRRSSDSSDTSSSKSAEDKARQGKKRRQGNKCVVVAEFSYKSLTHRRVDGINLSK